MYVADAAWPLVEERLAAGDAALLPIGAASKEHGYHLPLATDCRQAEWMTARLLESEPLLAWPVLPQGS